MENNTCDNSNVTDSTSRKLTVLEIRKDPELIRLHGLLIEANKNYDERIKQLYKENDIKPLEFTGLVFSRNEDSDRQAYLIAKTDKS